MKLTLLLTTLLSTSVFAGTFDVPEPKPSNIVPPSKTISKEIPKVNTVVPKTTAVTIQKTDNTKFNVKPEQPTPTKTGNCQTSTIAMTFHNIPTQKGPYFHRWMSLGCGADKMTFTKEGNDKFTMEWNLKTLDAKEYSIDWTVNDVDAKNTWKTSHTFSLDKPKTLSLSNNMGVTIRRVP